MTKAISSVNHKKYATQFGVSENVSRPTAMTSLELVDFINSHRKEQAALAGAQFPSKEFAKVEHSDFLKKVPKVLKVQNVVAGKFSSYYIASNGKANPSFVLPKRECCLMAMSYSYELQAAVYDHMTDLEDAPKGKVIGTLPDFTNPAAAARAWAEQFELQQIASQALIEAAPKIAFVERYVESTGLKGFRQTAKLLGANESRFREFLIDKKIMYRMGGEWQAYQGHIDAGRFEVRTGASDTGHAFNQSKFTPKGVNWVAGLWAQYNLKGVE